MKTFAFSVVAAWTVTVFALLGLAAGAATPEEVFRNPPREAKVGTYWHWMGGQVTEEGIRKDLDWFRRMGIGEASVFAIADICTPWARRIGNVPTGGMRPFDGKWWKLFAFACREGRKRGIDVGLHFSPGYTSTGGPWVPSRLAMRELVFNVTNAAEQISTEPHAAFPVYDEDTRRYDKPACAARQTDVVEIGVARGGIRVAHIPMGAFVQPTDWDTFGLECDKMNSKAVDLHIDHMLGELKRHLGNDLPAAGLGHVIIDSYEAGDPNWTPKMREEFRTRRGYDPLEFLPILGGHTNLYSVAEVVKFRADFDRTIKDLYRDVFYRRLYERLHAEGLPFANEPYEGAGGGPFLATEVSPFIDRLMVEFWLTSKGAKLYPNNVAEFRDMKGPDGRRHNVLGAEAFTAAPDVASWTEMPANLKPAADDAFLAGVNKLVLHAVVLQPWGDEVRPGVGMGRWGTHFSRNQTWAECGKSFFDYVIRCQALLQWGEPCEKRLDVRDARQIARTDGDRTLYFVVNRKGESRFYDDKTKKWLDPASGAIRNAFELPELTQELRLGNFSPALGDRTKSDDPAARYFSGTLTYRTRFDLPAASAAELRFSALADQIVAVRLNGRPAGTAWCAPYVVELPVAALKEKGNELEIDVTNAWRNRLIGDEQEPADCAFEAAPLEGGQLMLAYPDWFARGLASRPSKGRRCFTTWNYFTKDSKLASSGLIEPPTLMWKEK